ncbi:MAG: indole-3-glycerol phosphate synthase TrpC [Alphaproteobacteria bacterium]
MDTLEKICTAKRKYIQNKKKNHSYDELRDTIDQIQLPSGFLSKLRPQKGKAIIAEVKKASPSKGIIRENFEPLAIARDYKEAGATCLSVLTDQPFFQGRDDDLVLIKQQVDISVLRKDFMIDPYQIFESRALGADCILLIMAIIEDQMARKLYETAIGLNMDVIVEVHNKEELDRALRLDPMIIGVNNRDLHTMEVNLDTSRELISLIPKDIFKISESGIASADDIQALREVGYEGFLVGETLMREENVGAALQGLMK